MRSRYRDRTEAGAVLANDVVARALAGAPFDGAVVLGLPRGGVPVAAVVAARLGATLDVLAVRKIGAPGHHELAIGAVASGGLVILNDDVITQLGLPREGVDARVGVALGELAAQDERLRGDRPRPALTGRMVVIVDDGMATGATMRAAVAAVRTAAPTRVVAAVPVAPPDTCKEVGQLADDVVCPLQPVEFMAVGQWYRDFAPTTDADVLRLLTAYR